MLVGRLFHARATVTRNDDVKEQLVTHDRLGMLTRPVETNARPGMMKHYSNVNLIMCSIISAD